MSIIRPVCGNLLHLLAQKSKNGTKFDEKLELDPYCCPEIKKWYSMARDEMGFKPLVKREEKSRDGATRKGEFQLAEW